MKCCKCLALIEKNKRISYLNNKYKIGGEEVCESCVDLETYKAEEKIDRREKNLRGE